MYRSGCIMRSIILWLCVVYATATPQTYTSSSGIAKAPGTSTQRTRYVVYYRPTAGGGSSSTTSSVSPSTDSYKESDTIPTRQYIQVQQPTYSSSSRPSLSYSSEDPTPVRYSASGSYRSPAQYQQITQEEKPDYSRTVPQSNQVQTTRYYVTRPTSSSYQSTPGSGGSSGSGRAYMSSLGGTGRYVSSPEGASYVRVPQVAEQQLSYQTQPEGEEERGQTYAYAPTQSSYQGASSGGYGSGSAPSSGGSYGASQGSSVYGSGSSPSSGGSYGASQASAAYQGPSQGESYPGSQTESYGASSGGRYTGSSAYSGQGAEGYGGGAAGLSGPSEESYGGGERGISGLQAGGYRGSSSAYSGAPESSYGTSALQGYGESDGGRYQGLSSSLSSGSGLRGGPSTLSGGYRGSSLSPAQLQGSSSGYERGASSGGSSRPGHSSLKPDEEGGQSGEDSSPPRAPGFPASFRPPPYPFDVGGAGAASPFQLSLQGGQAFGGGHGFGGAGLSGGRERPFNFGIQGLASNIGEHGGQGFGNFEGGGGDEQFAASNQGSSSDLSQSDIMEILRNGAGMGSQFGGLGGFGGFGGGAEYNPFA